eukprot:scpid47813/ scgid7313/ 
MKIPWQRREATLGLQEDTIKAAFPAHENVFVVSIDFLKSQANIEVLTVLTNKRANKRVHVFRSFGGFDNEPLIMFSFSAKLIQIIVLDARLYRCIQNYKSRCVFKDIL